MPTFVYKAIDSTGQEVTATLDAASKEAVLDRLNLDQLCPVEVKLQDVRKSGGLATRMGRISK
ncbi:type II secretion system F family protein, partial [Planctomycetota bacterium]